MHKVEDLDLIFLIDRSGSMYGSEEDTIGGFNSFIEKEKLKEGTTRVTTILFDHEYEMLYSTLSVTGTFALVPLTFSMPSSADISSLWAAY